MHEQYAQYAQGAIHAHVLFNFLRCAQHISGRSSIIVYHHHHHPQCIDDDDDHHHKCRPYFVIIDDDDDPQLITISPATDTHSPQFELHPLSSTLGSPSRT